MIGGVGERPDNAANGRDIDHRTPAGPLHRRDDALGAQEHARRIHRHDAVPAFQCLFRQRRAGDVTGLNGHSGGSARDAGNVPQHVHLTIFPFGIGHNKEPAILIANIQRVVFGNAAGIGNLLCHSVPKFVLQVAQDDAGTVRGKQACCLGANAGSAAGNNRHFIEKSFSRLHVCFLHVRGLCCSESRAYSTTTEPPSDRVRC